MKISFEYLPDSTDARGLSFSMLSRHLSRIGLVADLHIAQVRPGSIRGNHYHLERQEMIAVVYQDDWSFYWDVGPGTDKEKRSFKGSGGVVVVPPKGWSHAVVNHGAKDLWVVASSDRPFDRAATDPVARDAYPRTVATL